jgi:hypothetical protein
MRYAHTSHREHDVADEIWLRDVSRIETSYGRLVYLAGLRDPNTGRYEHYGTGPADRAIANRSLKHIHELIFTEWIGFPLEKKMSDVEHYLDSIIGLDRSELIDAWLRLTPYKNLVPASIQGPERRKHISDFEAILGLLKNVYGVASPDLIA